MIGNRELMHQVSEAQCGTALGGEIADGVAGVSVVMVELIQSEDSLTFGEGI